MRVQADAYGVHLELTVDYAADVVTRQELARALHIATEQVLAVHADRQAAPCSP